MQCHTHSAKYWLTLPRGRDINARTPSGMWAVWVTFPASGGRVAKGSNWVALKRNHSWGRSANAQKPTKFHSGKGISFQQKTYHVLIAWEEADHPIRHNTRQFHQQVPIVPHHRYKRVVGSCSTEFTSKQHLFSIITSVRPLLKLGCHGHLIVTPANNLR